MNRNNASSVHRYTCVTGERFGIRFRTVITGNGDIDGTAITGIDVQRGRARTRAQFGRVIGICLDCVYSLVTRTVNIIVRRARQLLKDHIDECARVRAR